jgi:phage repressor protein C with HTH and peptisase S24 domain
MEIWERILSKDEINSRFIRATYAVISKGLIPNKTALAESLGVKPAKFSEILNNRMNVGADLLAQLTIQFPISPEWLLTGEGEMLRPEQSVPTAVPATQPGIGIPLIPIEAMAGFGTGEVQVLEYECDRYVVPAFKDAEFLIQVKGSSMLPKYNSGDIVACRKLPLDELFFQWNKVYVLDTNQGALIKRVKAGSDDDHLLIVSDNERYEPFELHKKFIHSVAIVIGVIRLE